MEFSDEQLSLIYFSLCISIQQYSQLLEDDLNKDDKILAINILNSLEPLEEKIRKYFEEEPISRPKWNQSTPNK